MKLYRQPQGGGAQIDWANPVTRGLVDAWNFSSLRSAKGTVATASAGLTVGPAGVGLESRNVNETATLLSNSSSLPTGPCTVVLVQSEISTAQRSRPAFAANVAASTTNEFHAFVPFSDGNVYWRYGDGTGVSAAIGPSKPVNTFVFTAGGALGRQIWQNGVNLVSDGSTITRTSTSNPLVFGDGGITAPLTRRYLFAVFNRQLSSAEIKSLSDNPWQLFQPLGWNLGFSPPASGPITHPASGDLLGGAAVLTGTATRLRAMTSSGALVGGGAALAGTARSNHQHPTAGVLGGAGATLAGTAARAGGAVTHPSSGVLVGQGATLAGTAARTPAVVTHAASGALSGQGAVLAGAAARVAAPVTHATSGALTGPGATLSGTAQNGAVAPPVSSSGGGGGARVKNRRELDDLLTRALKKPVEVAVQLLLPATPSPEAISTVIRALEAREAAANKSVARHVQFLLARLQVLEREAEEEEAVVMMLLLD